ncbi:aldose 1-epimerase [Stackebrandtia endophytica]|uniref:Aldose 1-epimerase n=1 Tax=Stackebrandtia endophytica TaxID=1496996 RepID=A0A543AX50_9ACTN|nr:aldose 1-epimerase family protein [Stackebrandtia endophytica]TQL77120.1 aldose 1-epimerase [Stackebrandtia endophytica]
MALSGEQWTISYSGWEAVIASVGGGVRLFSLNGKSYIDGYDDDDLAPGSAGHILAPWPGRVGDGEYEFGGHTHQLPWNEPTTRTAMHGLVGWLRWQAVDVTDSAVSLECSLPAQPGYPFPLQLRTRWSVGPGGLRAAHYVSNVGATACPFGLGVHPYLRLPGSSLAQWNLKVPAKTELTTDERQLPNGSTHARFQESTPIGDTVLDTSFGDLQRDSDRNARLVLTGPDDGEELTLWADESFGWFHVYTSDTLDGDRRRRSLAVEPMSCPPDAMRSGTDLVTLAPGELWSGIWGISPRK